MDNEIHEEPTTSTPTIERIRTLVSARLVELVCERQEIAILKGLCFAIRDQLGSEFAQRLGWVVDRENLTMLAEHLDADEALNRECVKRLSEVEAERLGVTPHEALNAAVFRSDDVRRVSWQRKSEALDGGLDNPVKGE